MIPLPGGEKVHADSTGKQINIGDRIRFCGRKYTLKCFGPFENVYGVATLIFEEELHTDETPNECTVDKI